MSIYSKQNEKAREKFKKLGHDFYYAKVTEYERRHTECDTSIRPNTGKLSSSDHDAECACTKWKYNYSSGNMEAVK
jgi:hypothetical protein